MSARSAKERVLIAPLHWGLGHATRCIPIIRSELALGNEVIIAAENGPKALLEAYFPDLLFISIPFMEITYPADGNMPRHFFFHGPRLIWSIAQEHRHLQRLIKIYALDRVISDARFGLWSRRVHCIFMSHQIEIQSPLFQTLINKMHRWVMGRYDEVWIPDHSEEPGLAGKLSHPKQLPSHAKYIGPLSRFTAPIVEINQEAEWDAVAIISGPEPQRSLFEADIVRRFIESGERLLLLRGRPGEGSEKAIGNIRIVPHLNDQELLLALQRSKRVISRSGYSTIMDLAVLGVSSVEYHPTPGQTEQEYLAQLQSK